MNIFRRLILAALLADGKERSTLDIAIGAKVCAVNSTIAELRANGLDIACRRQGDRWLYRLNQSINHQPTGEMA